MFVGKLCVVFRRNLGCGGYIVNAGNILKPTYPPSENSSAECVWYIESTGPENTILLTSQSKAIVPFPIIVSILFLIYQNVLVLQINRLNPGHVFRLTMAGLLKEPLFTMVHQEPQFRIYSFSRKTLIKFPAWNSLEREREYSWNVISVKNDWKKF